MIRGATQERLAVIKDWRTETYTDKTAKKETNYSYFIKPYLYQNGKRYSGRRNMRNLSAKGNTKEAELKKGSKQGSK